MAIRPKQISNRRKINFNREGEATADHEIIIKVVPKAGIDQIAEEETTNEIGATAADVVTKKTGVPVKDDIKTKIKVTHHDD